ncbi:MAG: GGDEF domain-containing protein [Azonexus sp.]|nr:GGDEF domain-containing protein [Azonexus sp.]
MSLKTLIFTDDKYQAIRIRRFLMAMVAYLLSYLLVCITYAAGYLDRWVIEVGVLIVGGVFGFFYLWLRSGLNRRMADPSLTLIQMVVATLVIMFLIYNAPHVSGLFLIIYLVVFMFGIFMLSTRQFVALAMFVLATYAFVIYRLRIVHPERISISEDVLQWIALACLLPFFGLLGGYIGSLRSKLRNSYDELQRAMEVIRDMAIHDELTGLYNRRHFMEMLSAEKSRADRSGQCFGLIMLDIDHFKRINDTHGHQAGDAVIHRVGETIGLSLRAGDFSGRFGGEEFILCIDQTGVENTQHCAERLRASIELLRPSELPAGTRVTVSLGITEYRRSEALTSTIARADAALYRAKANGRNRVEAG